MAKETKKVEKPVKENPVPKTEDKKVNPYDVACINLKLSIRQLNEVRSSILCKIASYQTKLECANNPQEIEVCKGMITILTGLARDLSNILNQAINELTQKPSIESSIDKPVEGKKN